MQSKYIDHYTAALFHRWFMNISNEMGDSQFRAVVQNFLYAQDPENPNCVRLQSFIRALRGFLKQLEAAPDPEVPPILYEVSLTKECEEEIEKIKKDALQQKVGSLKAALNGAGLFPEARQFIPPAANEVVEVPRTEEPHYNS